MITTIALLSGVLAFPAAADIPSHPDQILFPTLDFTPPVAAEFRHQLPSGVPVYLAPSTEFPLITVSFQFQGGAYLESPDETGLASAVGSLMRRGGTTSVSAEEMDEQFDFLAANVSSFVGPERSGASLNCLKNNFDEAFALFLDMLQRPGFDQDRIKVHQDQVIERLKQRNDAPMSVAMMSMGRLAWGDDHYLGRQPTLASTGAITPETLRAIHERIFVPANLFISATGDFEAAGMLEKLEAALAGWTWGTAAPTPPSPVQEIKPGLYHAAVAQDDLPQGTTILLTRAITRDDPDALPFSIMNDILGGGGFTSRITNRVRSDEGLAYSAMSFVQPNVHFPGIFGAFFQSKNRTVAYATKIIFEEIDRIRTEPVSAEELETAKNAFIERFPQQFASKGALLGVLVSDEMTGRDPNYWHEVRDRVRDLDDQEILRVAQTYLDANEMIVLVVGDWDEIYPGDLEGRATMNDFFGGNVEHLPMRDPLTLEPKAKVTSGQ